MWEGITIESHNGDLVISEFVANEENEMGEYLIKYIKKFPMPEFGTTFLVKPYEADGAWFAALRRFRDRIR